MNYQNPKIPEGINVSDEHPLKEFSILLIGVSAGLAIMVAILFYLAGFLVQFIPFTAEQNLAKDINLVFSYKDEADPENSENTQQIQEYLQQLADQLSIAQQLPKDMKITVHYIDDDTVNAFATIGGHIFMHRGLIEKLSSENALAMVLSHEIAHIKQRHPIIALGRGLTITLALAALTGFGDNGMVTQVANNLSLITVLAYNRGQETEADEIAFTTLKQHYQHTNGATELFTVLASASPINAPEILSTHPLSEERIKHLQSLQNKKDESSALTPLPEIFSHLKKSE